MNGGALLGACALLATSTAWSQDPIAGDRAMLRCLVTYAGTTHEVRSHPVDDPYTVASTDIGGRFWFKPVMVGEGRRVDYIALYAYQDTRRQPILVQEAKYLPPFPIAPHDRAPLNLTGQQHLYAGAVERELIFSCTLEGHAP